jgi:hypothetical protein
MFNLVHILAFLFSVYVTWYTTISMKAEANADEGVTCAVQN